MPLPNDVAAAIAAHVGPLPAHIEAAARACRYDLYHGPSFSRIPAAGIEAFTADDFATYADDLRPDCQQGDTITETYTGPVGDALRAYIETLPADLWIDRGAGYASADEPEAYQDDETGEWIEPDWSDCWHAESRDIVAALFGEFLSREFN